MKIFVINLENRADRRDSVALQLDPLSVEYEFFKAVSAADNPEQYFSGINNWLSLMETKRRAIPTELACYASHLLLWKNCVALNEPIVILEDDFSVTESFRAGLQFVAEHIDEYGYIRVEPIEDSWPLNTWEAPEVALSGDSFRLLFQVTVSLRTTGYALTPAVARKLIATSNKYTVPVDHFFRRQWVHRIPLFALDPPAISLGDLADDPSIQGREGLQLRLYMRKARKYYRRWAGYAVEKVNRKLRKEYSGLFRA